ncbi:MAG: 3-dehydroquinate synthase [Gemmatimonadota bacterium]|nr:3-dehydroquinate synthase [Gemmatimonadota bacterium]
MAELSLHGSRVVVGASLAGPGADVVREAAAGRRVALVTDTNVAPLHAAPLAARLRVDAADVFAIAPGEAGKTREGWARLTDAMLARGFGRDSVVVAVGGGVVGDLAGFVAATYMRGVPVVQVPTTLLAMIDAAVGGKTGVDAPAGKNLVGAFHHPLAVVADPAVLATLPGAELRNGLAEALKHALITSPAELGWLLDHAPQVTDPAAAASRTMAELVARNVRIKADVVRRDEREGGLRKMLNFGHTIGHAIEASADYRLPHGACVAVGMRVEARVAELAGIAAPGLAAAVTSALDALGLPRTPGVPVPPAVVTAMTRSDKKARSARVEYALLRAVGEPAAADAGYAVAVDDAHVAAALEECLGGRVAR